MGAAPHKNNLQIEPEIEIEPDDVEKTKEEAPICHYCYEEINDISLRLMKIRDYESLIPFHVDCAEKYRE